MKPGLKGCVVVITGASSGIGRATALAFAEEGAIVVVAARREVALRDVVREVEWRGSRGLAVPTDVTDEHQVQALADAALDAFGRIDVWVNDAGVSVLGLFNDVPLKDYKRVFETNVFGVVHGARAVMPVLLRQGSGTLINVSSVVTRMPQPYASAYVASKSAVRSLGMSLRQELLLQDAHDVHVVTVMPAVIDTPFFQSVGNYTGRTVQPPPPVNPARMVAEAIVKAAINPKREIYVGRGGRLFAIQMQLMPGLMERLAARMIDKAHLSDTPALDSTGNLFTPPANNGAISGGWPTFAAPSFANKIIAGVGVAALGGFAVWRKRR
jgi:short-subunit dehydrogenase